MSQRTVTYDSIVDKVNALSGVDSFNTDESTWLKTAINRRIRHAFNQSMWWPDYMVVGEPRPVINGFIPLVNEQVAYDYLTLGYQYYAVKNAQQDEYNGVYVSADLMSPFFVSTSGLTATSELWVKPDITADSSDNKTLLSGQSGGQYTYLGETDVSDVYEISWESLSQAYSSFDAENTPPEDVSLSEPTTRSENPWPTIYQIGNVDTMLRIHSADPFLGEYAYEYPNFYTNSNGISIQGQDATSGTVWCTYQKRLDDTYGDAEGETSTIPKVWAEYIAHAAFADRLRGQGFHERAAMEERFANSMLDEEVFRVESTQGSNIVTRFSTHTNRRGYVPSTY